MDGRAAEIAFQNLQRAGSITRLRGERRAGNYFAVMSFTTKVSIAAGGGLALIIAGLFGFSAEHSNGPTAMRGFFLAFIVIPVVLNGAAVLFAYGFPLDPRRQAIVRRRIEGRQGARLGSAPPLV